VEKPKEPLLRIIKEGEEYICLLCHSSLKTKWFGLKILGCYQPECKNYYRGKNGTKISQFK